MSRHLRSSIMALMTILLASPTLSAATRVSAELPGWSKQVGAIAARYYADMVASARWSMSTM